MDCGGLSTAEASVFGSPASLLSMSAADDTEMNDVARATDIPPFDQNGP